MKGTSLIRLCLILLLPLLWVGVQAQDSGSKGTIFDRSLHFTAKGMSYWYDKANGGLEVVSGVPYAQLGCQDCHVATCDQCHVAKTDETAYSTKAARNQEMCLTCHAREASIFKIDKAANQVDVHTANGMTCMDCHTAGEMHGNGTEFVSMKQSGAMEITCEKCHTPGASLSHTTHNGKVDCKACHDRQVVSCTNCHFETLVKEGKRVAMPVSGWMFLMNLDGKVTCANMQSFVVKGKKTFIMFAPQHSHSVTAKGRKCEECHATEAAKQAQQGSVKLTWLEGGKLQNLKGVVPVAANVKWGMAYHEREDGKWVPMSDALEPVLHYAGYGKPLTADQMKNLVKPQTGGK